MADNDATNVNVMKGVAAGYAYWAPLGTKYDATMVKTRTVPAGFKPLGYVTSDGIVNSFSSDSDTAADLNGVTVATIKTSYEETFQQVFMERTEETLKLYFGSENVSSDSTSAVQTIKHNSSFDSVGFMLLYRLISKETDAAYEYTDIWVPSAKISERGDITLSGTGLYQLDATVSALPDTEGNCAYEYTASVNKS